jgi:hypothetical protein
MGASFWYEAYRTQKQENVDLEAKLSQVETELEQRREKLNKLQGRIIMTRKGHFDQW